MLADPMSPLGSRWSYALKAAPWFLRFLEVSRASRVAEISKHLWALSKDAMAAHRRLIELSKAHDIVRPTGWLKVYSSQRSFERPAEERAGITRRGWNFDVLTSEEIIQREPGLPPQLTHGSHTPD